MKKLDRKIGAMAGKVAFTVIRENIRWVSQITRLTSATLHLEPTGVKQEAHQRRSENT